MSGPGSLYSVLVSGVDLALPGNGGGAECHAFRGDIRLETTWHTALMLSLAAWALTRIRHTTITQQIKSQT